MPFLSGLSTVASSLAVQFTEAEFSHERDEMAFSFVVNANGPVDIVAISYLVFSMHNPRMNITSMPPESAYSPLLFNAFPGIANIAYGTKRLSSNPTPNEKQAFDMIFGINGVVVQTQQNIDLFGSSRSHRRGSGRRSAETCPEGQFPVYEQVDVYQIKLKCVSCDSGQQYNYQYERCQ